MTRVSAASLLVTLLPLVTLPGCQRNPGSNTTSSSDAAPSATAVADAEALNVLPIPAASVAKMVNPDGLPAYAGPTGSVEGTITVVGDPAPSVSASFSMCPEAEKSHGHAFREGVPAKPGDPRWLADAVVAVTGYGKFFIPEKAEAKTVEIRGCSLTTRTVTMTFGQRLEVKNLTRDFWTPKLEPAQSSVLMMATPGGDPVKLYPKKPGHYRLVDHDRKYAVEDLYAFLHPLHTSTAIGGTYRIDGVPVGKVTVNTSHPQIPDATASRDVTIREGVVTHVDLTLSYKAPDAGAPASDDAPKLR
jgi:hypothetical protein